MVRRQDRFSGNILLYDYLAAKRAPVFLNRNLTRALRIHHQLSEGISRPVIASGQSDLRSAWTPPSWDALDYMMHLETTKGSFNVDIHRIVPDGNSATNSPPEYTGHSKKARSIYRNTISLNVQLCDSIGREITQKPPQEATLQNARTTAQVGRSVSFDTKRITFTLDRRSKPSPAQLNLSIKIEVKELLEYLIPGNIPDPNATRLSATWRNILEVPSEKKVIDLQDWRQNVVCGLEVSMYWAGLEGDSVLGETNRRRRQSTLSGMSSPTPRPKTAHQSVKVTFKFGESTISRDGFCCPIHLRKSFTCMEELCMHLDGQHGNMTYRPERHGIDEDGIENWTVLGEASCHTIHKGEQRPSARADEPFDNAFIAPNIPFDRRQHLEEGIADFQRLGRANRPYTGSGAAVTKPINTIPSQNQNRAKEVSGRFLQTKKKYAVPAAPPGITFFRSCSRRPLVTGEYISESDDDADDTWIRNRKSAEFDKKANLSAIAKEFLKIYDNHMRSEQLHSDVHAGDALIRFARERGEWLWRNNANDVFKQKLDELLADRIINEDVHSTCLEYVEKLRSDMVEENNDISERLAGLEVRRTTHDELYKEPSPPRSGQKRNDKGKGKARVTETGHLTPVTADSDGDLEMREATLSIEVEPTNSIRESTESTAPLPYDSCLCGEDAQASYRKSPLVACSSMNCIRRTFHYDCIKERWKITQDFRALRKSAWVCEDCKPHSAAGN